MSFIAENPLLLAEVEGITRTPFGGTRGIYAGKDGFYSIDDKGNVGKIVTEKDVTETINNLNSLYYYGDINIKPSDSSLFDFTINEDGETATVHGKFNGDYYEFKGDAVIPYECKIENKTYQVTSVGYFAHSPITSVVIPRCVTNIGFSAFSYCQELTNVIIPDGLEIISGYAFMGCDKIKNITIPTSVTEIGYAVFGNTFGSLENIYFKGTKEQWEAIEKNKDNEDFLSATIHYDWCDGSSGSGGGSSEGEENVQADWNETNERSDAFIKNKPIITIDCNDKMWSNWEENSKTLNQAGFYKLVNLPNSGAGEYVFLIVQSYNEAYATITQWAITSFDILFRYTDNSSGDWVWTDWGTLYARKIHKHSYNDLTDKPTVPVVEQSYNAESENAQSGKAVAEAIAKLLNGSPEALDTLYELAKALGNDPNFAATVMDAIGKKVDKVDGYGLVSVSNFDEKVLVGVNGIAAYLFYDSTMIDNLLGSKVDTDEYEQFRDDVKSGDIRVHSSEYSDHANRANDATNAMNDWDGNDIQQTYARIRPDIMTDIPDTLSPNQTYHLYEAPSSIVFPSSDIVDGDTIYLTFMTGDTPPTIEFYTNNTTDIDIVIEANTGYEIYGKYVANIDKWIVGYSEYTITDGDSV